MEFRNTYEEARRAAAYDELELGGTYHLVFRDLPGLLSECVTGKQAVDFGCGTGRSTSSSRLVETAVGLRFPRHFQEGGQLPVVKDLHGVLDAPQVDHGSFGFEVADLVDEWSQFVEWSGGHCLFRER